MIYLNFSTLVICAAICLILYTRLVRPLKWKKRWKLLLLIPIVLLSLIPFLALPFSRYVDFESPYYWMVKAVFYIFSLDAVLLILIVIRDIIAFILKVSFGIRSAVRSKKDPAFVEDEAVLSRRKFLFNLSSGAIAGGAALVTPISAHAARHDRVIKNVEIRMDNLPEELEGFRIAHLSDVHVGNTIDRQMFSEIVNETNLLQPDLVAITGDLVDGYPEQLKPELAPIVDLKSTYGTFYCTGNHEHMWDGPGWCDILESYGVHVLKNTHEMIPVPGGKLAVAGVYDISVNRRRKLRSSPSDALSGIPEDVFRIMLVHQPKSVDPSLEAGADVVLLGHTHGGQSFPLNLMNPIIHKYARGMYRVGHKAVFVSCGTGYWGPPLRIGVPPEIILVTLRKAS